MAITPTITLHFITAPTLYFRLWMYKKFNTKAPRRYQYYTHQFKFRGKHYVLMYWLKLWKQ